MSKSIMIVEDDQLFHDLYADLLEGAGYGIIRAHDGGDALEKLYDGEPDLIILDMGLYLINGDTFFQYIKNIPEFKDIPVIIISGMPKFVYKNLDAIKPNLTFLDKALIGEKLIGEIEARIG